MSDADNFSMMDLFREEVRAHAATLNQGLLDLENDPANPQRIEPLMRAAHSIKGAARIVNIDAAVKLAHVLEDAFVAAQEGRIRISPADTDLLLQGADLLGSLSEITEEKVPAWSATHAGTIAEFSDRLQRLARGQPTETAPLMVSPPERTVPRDIQIPPEPFVLGEEASMLDLFREEVRAAALLLGDSLTSPQDDALESRVQAAHSITGAARIAGVQCVIRLGQSLESFLSTAQAKSPANALEAIALLAEMLGIDPEALPGWLDEHVAAFDQAAERLAGEPGGPAPASYTVLSTMDDGRSTQSGAVDQASVTEPEPRTPPAPLEQPAAISTRPPAPAEIAATAEAVVRVTAQSLNRLMGLAGESLVQARWLEPFATALHKLRKQQDHVAVLLDGIKQELAGSRQLSPLARVVAEAQRQTSVCREVLADRIREFQDHAAQAEDHNTRLYREVIASRMRPFGDGTGGFPRLVRDMARNLGKLVRLEIEGQSTEVDRDVLEKLEAPLTHLLRNALDHGLELPEERKAAGKLETGLVRLEACHRAGMLAIIVADDGRGIDCERLRQKVVERGLTTADMARNLNEPELLEFLFLPGFSTASTLTEYSGRGVGLDVVQSMVRKVGGSVRISTQLGRGTTFHLQMPITLSVLRAVLVEVAGEPYAFPHNRIDRLLRVPVTDIRSVEQRQFVTVDGHNVGLVSAAQLLELPSTTLTGDSLPVVLLSDHSGYYGLLVDAFGGEQDLVVRPLDVRLGKVPNLGAAAILDDGSPVLLADVEDLVRSMEQFIQGNRLRRYDREEPADGARRRVLVVDDSITVREVERQLLRNHGYDVAVAVDGMQGWNLVRAERFDLVISDVDMPRMNGLDLVRSIRGEPGLKNLPVILVSYKERPEDRLRGLEVGANCYLTKSSFHDNTFLEAVADLIGEN